MKALLLAILLAWSPHALCVAEGFSLNIAVPLQGDARYIRYDVSRSSFHVVLENKSEHDKRIWESWNSWGYYNLSFELTNKDGKLTKIDRGINAWTMNAPSYITLKPGEMHVFEVELLDNWTNVPVVSKQGEEFTLRAIFKNRADKDSNELGVWTGEVKSQALEVRLKNLKADDP